MKEEVQIAWVEALRSGKFEQCSEALCRIDPEGNKSFCCLGVLCTLAEEAGVTRGQKFEHDSLGTLFTWDGVEKVLPPSVLDWAGLRSPTGKHGAWTSLAMLNDRGNSFESLASTIEEEGHAL